MDDVSIERKREGTKQNLDDIDSDLESFRFKDGTSIQDSESVCILIVDEKPLAQTMMLMLHGLGYSVEIVNNGAEALLKTLKKPYDLVIVEEDLPDSNGAEISQVIKKMDERTKTIVLTSVDYNNYNNYKNEIYKGIDEILIKPFTPSELIKTVRKITECKRVKEIDFVS